MITVSPEEITAWTDGEITGQREKEIAAAVAQDTQLQAQVAAHRALKEKLGGHFAPIAAVPVPDRLANLLKTTHQEDPPAQVVDFAAAKERIAQRRTVPRWGWIAGPALAASLALAVFLPRGGDDALPGAYADTQLASVLDTQLVAQQGNTADTRILLSFQNDGGEFCRAYSSDQAGGIACRDDDGWRIEATGDGADDSTSQYRMAGAAEVMAEAQELAAGPALDAEAEAAARKAGWR